MIPGNIPLDFRRHTVDSIYILAVFVFRTFYFALPSRNKIGEDVRIAISRFTQ